MGIIVYNKSKEEHEGENVFYCGRPSVLGNPYSYLPEDKCIAQFRCKSREESIEKYGKYFDIMYGSNKDFTKAVDEIYDLYKNGQTVYLGCWCAPKKCHCDIIVEKLRKRLIKEKLKYEQNFV